VAERLALGDPSETYEHIRHAAEVHRQVRQAARAWIRPGRTMTEIANYIEDGTRALVEEQGLDAGVGFPTGLSINHCAAHYTPNAGDSVVLKEGDVLKVDIGVHVKGRICDSAFTLNFGDPAYDRLLEAVNAATETGIRVSDQDSAQTSRRTWCRRKPASTSTWASSAGSSRRRWSHTKLKSTGQPIPVRPLPPPPSFHADALRVVKVIRNLSGHSINPYQIHGGKSVGLVRSDDPARMEEGEYYAIETFGSTGRGLVIEQGECSHYARVMAPPRVPLRCVRVARAQGWRALTRRARPRLTSAKSLLASINRNFGTLPWCRRYLDRAGEKNYLLAVRTIACLFRAPLTPPPAQQPGQPGHRAGVPAAVRRPWVDDRAVRTYTRLPAPSITCTDAGRHAGAHNPPPSNVQGSREPRGRLLRKARCGAPASLGPVYGIHTYHRRFPGMLRVTCLPFLRDPRWTHAATPRRPAQHA
jgi:methionyl aminopeptidase